MGAAVGRQRARAARFVDGVRELIPVGLTHNLSIVMPGLVPGIHVFLATKRGAGGRDIRAFMPVGVYHRAGRRPDPLAGYARP
jgi:hypothetical protein